MKVLHVIASMDPKTGGVCQAVRTMVSGLNALDVQNCVVSLDEPDNAFIGFDNINFQALGPAKSPWAFSKFLKPWLIESIGQYNAVIVHGLWLYPSYITAKCLNQIKNKDKEVRTRLFIMPHGMLDPYFQKSSSRKLKALRNKIYWQLIESSVINKADGLLFTCEEEMILARIPFKPYHPKKEIVVGLGVEEPPAYQLQMQEAFYQKCPDAKNVEYLLFLGRLHEKKGVDLLVTAYLELLSISMTAGKKMPKLVIAGPGLESAFGEQLQKTVQSVDQNKNVLFPGMLEGNAKWGAFYSCSAFILPSHQENFGIAVVEALACGKPVLISNQVNIWREIESFNAGIVNDDSAAGIKSLLQNWEHLTETDRIIMGKNAKDCFLDNFAEGQAIKKLFEALR